MEQRLKERLTGAVVLMLAAVIFIPMILDNAAIESAVENETGTVPAPDYRSRIMPVQGAAPTTGEPVRGRPADAGIVSNERPSAPVPAVTPVPDNTPPPAEEPVDEPVSSPAPVATEINVAGQGKATATPSAVADQPPTSDGLEGWVVQLGSFSSERNAESLVRDLQAQDYPAYIEEISNEDGPIYRVRVGPEVDKADAERAIRSLAEKFGLKGILLQYP